MSDDNIDDELQKIREEMNEIKSMLKEKRTKTQASHKDRFVFDSTTENIDFDSLGSTVEDYVESVLSGVQANLTQSMQNLSQNYGVRMKAQAAREVAREANKAARQIEREFRHKKKEFRRAKRDMERKSRRIRYKPLSEEERQQFFEDAPGLISAISDARRLMILKELELGPKYPSDFTETLDFKGGTLKHHLDNLLDVGFIAQEKVRGRYLISQLGMEALKLSEMLFRRSQIQKITSDETDEFSETEFEEESVEVPVAVDVEEINEGEIDVHED